MSRGLSISRGPSHQPLVEQLDECVAHVLADVRQPVLDVVVEAEHLAVPAVEELHVARLVDLLGREERLLLLVLVGHDEARELGRDALLADEERGEPPEALLLLLVERRPVLVVVLEVDRLRVPVLALPQLVELLRVHQLERRPELPVVGDRAEVALVVSSSRVAMSHPTAFARCHKGTSFTIEVLEVTA